MSRSTGRAQAQGTGTVGTAQRQGRGSIGSSCAPGVDVRHEHCFVRATQHQQIAAGRLEHFADEGTASRARGGAGPPAAGALAGAAAVVSRSRDHHGAGRRPGLRQEPRTGFIRVMVPNGMMLMVEGRGLAPDI